MNRFRWLSVTLVGVFLILIGPGMGRAGHDDDLRYWGYSSELINEARKAITDTHAARGDAPGAPPAGIPQPIDEPTSVQQQLTELGRTRSLHPESQLAIDAAKGRLEDYWSRMGTGGRQLGPTLGMVERQELAARIKNGVEAKGYLISRLELHDAPANLGQPQVKAWIRASRPMKSRDPYREAQANLAELKELTMAAGTVDGVCLLSEMTIFVAEDPNRRHYYEKTILLP